MRLSASFAAFLTVELLSLRSASRLGFAEIAAGPMLPSAVAASERTLKDSWDNSPLSVGDGPGRIGPQRATSSKVRPSPSRIAAASTGTKLRSAGSIFWIEKAARRSHVLVACPGAAVSTAASSIWQPDPIYPVPRPIRTAARRPYQKRSSSAPRSRARR